MQQFWSGILLTVEGSVINCNAVRLFGSKASTLGFQHSQKCHNINLTGHEMNMEGW